MIEMSGAPTGLLATEGHRDEIELRRDHKEEIWDPTAPPPEPIARRRARIPIPERCDFEGNVVLALDEEAVRRGVRRLQKLGVESIAVCFLFSFVNPDHERRARELILEEFPDVGHISLSHEVLPRAPEFERTSTTLVNAYVAPKISAYVDRLVEKLRLAGFDGQVVLMQSSGGVMPPQSVQRRAVSLLGSGPTGGVMGAALAAGRSGVHDLVAADMGGTSYDVCLVQDGQPAVATDWNWRHRYYVNLPMVDIHSVGAGGGSIARVRQGALLVGPDSAGSVPGPVCYGRGGVRATVTDSDAALGYLPAKGFAGGRMELDVEAGRAAIARDVAEPLGLDVDDAAWAMQRIVNANMANAVRKVLSQHGADPRTLSLVAYGGGGAGARLGAGPRAGHRPRPGAQGLTGLLRAGPARVRLRRRPDARLRRQALRHRPGPGAGTGGRAAPRGGGRAGAGPARRGRRAGRPLRADVLPRAELRHVGAAARGRGAVRGAPARPGRPLPPPARGGARLRLPDPAARWCAASAWCSGAPRPSRPCWPTWAT